MSENFFEDGELSKNPPVKRAAYSDRTAWIMAEISRLVYQPLPLATIASRVNDIIEAVKLNDPKHVKVKELVEKTAKYGLNDTNSNLNIIEESLKKANFELLESWSINGTEAILVRQASANDSEGMLVLAFRGTQLKDWRDVRADAMAQLISFDGGGKVHQGFLDAFKWVEEPITKALIKYNDKNQLPVYITGHSLGGALAIIATRILGSDKLCSDNIGATYTYGCPRVADEVFYEPIKTPVYRIVNAADGVARVPFGFIMSIFLSLIRLIPINGTRWLSKLLERYFKGYTHYGNLIFLSGEQNDITVRMSPDIFWQALHVIRRWVNTGGKAAISDHSVKEYSLKLLKYAKKRNS